MQLTKRTSRRRLKQYQAWLLVLASPLIASRVAGTQGILADPAPSPLLIPQAMLDSVTNNEMTVFAPAIAGGDNGLPQPFQYGPVTLRPHVDYSFSYGNGILAGPTNQQNTATHQISPGILAQLGYHWTLDYTPTIRFYSNNQFKDGVDHALSLVGGTHYEDWTLGLSQSFLFSTAPTSETGAQTEQEAFGTGLTATRVLNEKLSLDLGLNQAFASAAELQTSRDWSTMDWINYRFTPRLSVGAGAGMGYLNVDFGSDQMHEQLQARVEWRATDKLSLQLTGGGEDRQYVESTTPDSLTPIFSGGIQYQPFQNTQISVSAGRSVTASLVPGSDTTATSFGANLNQRLLQKFSLDVGASYNQSEYTETTFQVKQISATWYQASLRNVGRTDDYYSFNVRLSHPFLRRGTWSVYYQYNDNQSSTAGMSYRGSQIGFNLSYRY